MEQIRFTDEQIGRLVNNKKVSAVCGCTFMLSEDAFLELREDWMQGHEKDRVVSTLKEWGFTSDLLVNGYITVVIWGLRRSGMAAPGSPQIKRLISDIALSTSGSFYA